MRKLYEFFESEHNLIDYLDYNISTKNICWYPSSDLDFRHIYFFEKEKWKGKLNILYPDIYLFSSILLQKGKKPLFWKNQTFMNQKLLVLDAFQLSLKIDFWNPSDKIMYKDFIERCYSHQIWFFLLECNLLLNDKQITTKVPCIFFTYENFNFFTDFILFNQFKISHLIHIQDGGGSMGGSKMPMFFIYPFSDEIGLKYRLRCGHGYYNGNISQDTFKNLFEYPYRNSFHLRIQEEYHKKTCEIDNRYNEYRKNISDYRNLKEQYSTLIEHYLRLINSKLKHFDRENHRIDRRNYIKRKHSFDRENHIKWKHSIEISASKYGKSEYTSNDNYYLDQLKCS